LPDVDLEDAGREARELYGQLRSSEELRVVAARMMTAELGPAVQRILGLTDQYSLKEIMTRARESLARDGVELILLLEDLAAIQGLQDELLEVLRAGARQGGKQVLCTVRAAFAVTDGYWLEHVPETFRERCRYPFTLNLRYGQGDGGWSPEDVRNFLGRYLNAARVGVSALERRYGSATEAERSSGDWVPNQCDDCPLSDKCHPGFETDSHGYGLYPFNPASIDRIIRSMVRAQAGGTFHPRGALMRIRATLQEDEEAIRDGTFPTKSFRSRFDIQGLPQLPYQVLGALEDRFGDVEEDRSAQRWRTLLEFWGGTPRELGNLDPAIHEAFQLPELEVGPLPPQPPPVPPEGPTDDDDPVLRARLEQLDAWAGGSGTLDQPLSDAIRGFFHESVMDEIDWEGLLISRSEPLVASTIKQTSFVIQHAYGRGPAANQVRFAIEANPQNAALLEGVIRFLASRDRGDPSWNFPEGPARFREFREQIRAWAGDLEARLRSALSFEDDGRGAVVVRMLALTSLVLGMLSPSDGPADKIAALLAPDRTPGPKPPGVEVSPVWDDYVRDARESRVALRAALLRFAGARQGRAPDAVALDAAAILPVVDDFLGRVPLSFTAAEARVANEFHKGLTSGLDVAVHGRRQAILQWLEGVEPPVEGSNAGELVSSVEAAASALVQVGLFRPGDMVEELRSSREQVTDEVLDVVVETRELIDRDPASLDAELVRDLGVWGDERTHVLQRFVRLSDLVLNESELAVAREFELLDPGSGAGGMDGAFDSTLASIDRALERMGDV
jgi:hypothetical protein